MNIHKTRRAAYWIQAIQAAAMVFLFVAVIWFPHLAPVALVVIFSTGGALIAILLFSLYDKN